MEMEIERGQSELASHSRQQRAIGMRTRPSFKEVIMQALGIKYVGLVMNPLVRNLLHDELERIVPHIVDQVEFAVRQEVHGELRGIISQIVDQTTLVMRQQIHEEVMNAIIQINTQTDGIMVQQGGPLIAHANHLLRSPRLHIEEAGPAAPNLQLSFQERLLGTTFYAEECIKDKDHNNLQVALRKIESGQIYSSSLGFPVEVEIVVIDGDFPSDSISEWSTEDFNSNILKEREGRKPLLYGAYGCKARLHEGIASFGEIKLTDSSIFVKSRKFKLGAKVVSPSSQVGWMIKPAVTEWFVVLAERSKQHRKNYPPSLDDEVFRLCNIRLNGIYMQRLAAHPHHITTVKDFLKLSVVDPKRLQKITKMSTPKFNDTVRHAHTCNKGEVRYRHSREPFELILNSVCEVQSFMINGVPCQLGHLTQWEKERVEELVSEAYNNWDNLERFYGNSLSGSELGPSFPVSQNMILTGTGAHTNELQLPLQSHIGNAQENWNCLDGSNGASSSGIIQNGPSLDFSCQDPYLGAHNHFDSILRYLDLESHDII